MLYKFFTVTLLLVFVSVASADKTRCESFLTALVSSPTDSMKRLITLLDQKSFVNTSILKKIVESEKYFDFIELAHFQGLFKYAVTYLSYQTVFKKLDKNEINWEDIKNFSKTLLLERTKKDKVVKTIKAETKSLIIGKQESVLNLKSTGPATILNHYGRWLVIAATPVIRIFDFYTGEKLAEIFDHTPEEKKIQVIQDGEKIKLVFYYFSGVFKTSGVYISDITDLNNIRTDSYPMSFGQYELLPFISGDKQHMIVYDLAHRDPYTIQYFNISKMTVSKDPKILTGPKPKTAFQIVKKDDQIFFAYGDEQGNIHFINTKSEKVKVIKASDRIITDFKVVIINGRQLMVTVDDNSKVSLIDVETGNIAKNISNSSSTVSSRYGRLYVFKHQDRDFVALFGFNTVDIYELPTLELFKSYSKDKSIVAGFMGGGNEQMFSFEGRTYFVILLRNKVVVVNSLTEEIVSEFKISANSVTLEKTENGVIASFTENDGKVYNVTLVGDP